MEEALDFIEDEAPDKKLPWKRHSTSLRKRRTWIINGTVVMDETVAISYLVVNSIIREVVILRPIFFPRNKYDSHI